MGRRVGRPLTPTIRHQLHRRCGAVASDLSRHIDGSLKRHATPCDVLLALAIIVTILGFWCVGQWLTPDV